MGFRRTTVLSLQLLAGIGCILLPLGNAVAANNQELPTQAKQVEGILVPVPKEIFRTLDQFQDANWRAVQRPEVTRWKSTGDQAQIALLLGVVVAEGFIAMEAQDPAEVREVGRRVLILARALAVEQTALRRSRSIMEYAEHNEWSAARKEWDNVLSDLEKGMIALKSESLSHLVSLAGWLRGTEALSSLVMQDYSPGRANLLRQTAIIDYLEQQLLRMEEPTASHPMVMPMRSGLKKIRSLVEGEGNMVPEKAVREIGSTCHDLVMALSHRQ